MKLPVSIAAFLLVALFAWISCFAADSHTPPPATPETTSHESAPDAHAAPAANQPLLPPPGIRWPAVMLIIVLGMFLAAMVVGPVVRMTMPPEEPPVAQGHHDDDDDDAHGHDHGHGRGHARPRTPLDGH
jgi:hypothetical protein